MTLVNDIDQDILRCVRRFSPSVRPQSRRVQAGIDRLPENPLRSAATFAADAARYFAGLPLRGKRYLDLSGDVGQRARAAMSAGAASVTCLVSDPALARLIELINLYSRAGGISVLEGEDLEGMIGAQGAEFGTLLVSRADDPRIGAAARWVTEVLLVELASLSGGWLGQCRDGAGSALPFFLVSRDSGTEDLVARIAFGRTTGALSDAIVGLSLAPERDATAFVTLDLAASPRVTSLCGQRHASRNAFAGMRAAMAAERRKDERRIAFYLSELLAGLSGSASPSPRDSFASDTYWFAFFTGVMEFMASGSVARTNTYVRYLLELASSDRYDPDMRAVLQNWDLARVRMTRRFEDVLDILRSGETKHPITVINPLETRRLETCGLAPPAASPSEYVRAPDGALYWTPMIDGHHRAVSLYLSGASTTDAIFVWTNIHDLALRPAGATGPAEPIGWGHGAVFRAVEETIGSLAVTDRLERTAA